MTSISVAKAVGFDDRPETVPRIRLLTFRPMVKGALRGSADVELACGLRIRDVPVRVGRNGAWANLPVKPQLDKDGRQKIGADGKPACAAILEWRDRETANRFSEAVIGLVRARDPHALDGGIVNSVMPGGVAVDRVATSRTSADRALGDFDKSRIVDGPAIASERVDRDAAFTTACRGFGNSYAFPRSFLKERGGCARDDVGGAYSTPSGRAP